MKTNEHLSHAGKKGMKWGYNDGVRNGKRTAVVDAEDLGSTLNDLLFFNVKVPLAQKVSRSKLDRDKTILNAKNTAKYGTSLAVRDFISAIARKQYKSITKKKSGSITKRSVRSIGVGQQIVRELL